MEYLIIGNSATGVGCIEGIREHDKKGNITVISDEPYHAYSRPLISYYLADLVEKEKMKYRDNDFYKNNNVQTLPGKKAVKLESEKKVVTTDDNHRYKFDKLLIATGGKTSIPPIQGIDRENIFTFLKLHEAELIKKKLQQKGLKRVLILGAGLIGLKAAEALTKKGVKVRVVELADQILNRILDKKAATFIQSWLEKKGINFFLNNSVKLFTGKNTANSAVLKNGVKLDFDLAIIATGVKPNLNLIETNDIKHNQGIIVNQKMETNTSDIYAAGDVAEGYDLINGASAVIPIWPNAYHQGYTAGLNMAGYESVYREGFARNSISFFELPMVTAGIINPGPDTGYQILTKTSTSERIYKKVIIKNNKLKGFIFINQIDRVGILTGLMKEEKDISGYREELLSDNLGLNKFNDKWRRQKMG